MLKVIIHKWIVVIQEQTELINVYNVHTCIPIPIELSKVMTYQQVVFWKSQKNNRGLYKVQTLTSPHLGTLQDD